MLMAAAAKVLLRRSRRRMHTPLRPRAAAERSTEGAVRTVVGRTSCLFLEKGKGLYSITSSARLSNVAGISRPSAFAVLRLMSKSNLVGW